MSNATPREPSSLVSTDWVAEHLNDLDGRLLEVDVDTNVVHNLQFISNDAPLAALRRRYLVTNVVAAELEKDYFSSRLRAELKRREALRLV